MMRPVESYVIQRPMTRRDWAMAMAAFASMGLTACMTEPEGKTIVLNCQDTPTHTEYSDSTQQASSVADCAVSK